MFSGCYNLTSFDADLSSLTIGAGMFQNCYGLTSFNSDLISLTNGAGMFCGCYGLTSFDADLRMRIYPIFRLPKAIVCNLAGYLQRNMVGQS